MQPMHFRGEYQDARGTEPILIRNEGTWLKVSIRGVEFEGRDLNLLDPVGDIEHAKAAGFTICNLGLCACTLRLEIPVRVAIRGDEAQATVGVQLVLGNPDPTGGADREDLQLTLTVGAQTLKSFGTTGWFEDELLHLNRQLTDGAYIRTCINCAFSDYSPAGHGIFGDLMCFRSDKEAYRAVNSKSDFLRLMDQGKSEDVQETHCCNEFERREPGTGYRG